ncbi:unnamed protein product, partial [Tenebrio molitor]
MSDRSDSENEVDVAEEVWNVVIPEKSKERYENTYKIFKNWATKKCLNIDEKSLLAYFVIRNEKLKSPSSLWAEYSMLKSTIFLHDSVDISKFSTVIAFLKKKNVGYRPKKANIFTKEEFTKFLLEAPDKKFLALKVGMILGIVGACRREDLYTMRIEDFEEREGLVIVKVPQKKRSFIVINEPDEKAHYLDIYYKYRNLRPSHAKSSHFFLNYRNEKCTNQVIGKGTIGSWPSKIAEYLKLKNPAGYTGNSFRRSALLANKIEDPGLKRHGGCKSSITAEKDCAENDIQFQEDKENSENICKPKGQASGEGSSSAGHAEINKNTRVGNLPTAEVNFEDNTDDQTDNVVEAKAEADDAGLRLETSEATSEDNSNELGYDSVDYADEIQTELDDCDVYVRTTEASFEEVNETSHDRADQISEVNTKANDIDIEEELRNPSPISIVHARKRKTLDMEHALMNLTDAVKAIKSPLQEDEDLAFFYSLLPLVRGLNT